LDCAWFLCNCFLLGIKTSVCVTLCDCVLRGIKTNALCLENVSPLPSLCDSEVILGDHVWCVVVFRRNRVLAPILVRKNVSPLPSLYFAKIAW
jgi:hypothetical protein